MINLHPVSSQSLIANYCSHIYENMRENPLFSYVVIQPLVTHILWKCQNGSIPRKASLMSTNFFSKDHPQASYSSKGAKYMCITR